jgi:ribosome recycling factor
MSRRWTGGLHKKAIEAIIQDLNTVNAERMNAAMLALLCVACYGSPTPLNKMSHMEAAKWFTGNFSQGSVTSPSK